MDSHRLNLCTKGLPMRPPLWHPPVPLSRKEQRVVSKIRRAKLVVFLRTIRHDLFDDAFPEELGTIFKESSKGQPPVPPVPPAPLALATILQAYTGVSDDEVIEATLMDLRWQLVLDCLDCEQAPFGQGTLVRFRQALIAHTLDRRLIERTVEVAEREEGFGPRQLRAALDSSPLWGAGRVEDTYHLRGHALRQDNPEPHMPRSGTTRDENGLVPAGRVPVVLRARPRV